MKDREFVTMTNTTSGPLSDRRTITAAADAAGHAIPPVWPLASSVAVNPYLGQSDEPLAHAAARLARVSGMPVVMPRTWYRDKIECGAVTESDLGDALAAADPARRPASVAALKATAFQPIVIPDALSTIAELSADVSGIDWPGIIAERFGAWAGAYFDEGQALWAMPKGSSAYAGWRAIATHDLTPEIAGLRGFASFVAEAPEDASDALAQSTARLGLPPASLETYYHRLLTTLGGWAQCARYRLWQATLAGGDDGTIRDFLAIRLIWEEALFRRYGERIADRWRDVVAAHAAPLDPSEAQIVEAILQEAVERAVQRDLAATLASPNRSSATAPPLMQVAFCIDVRSEVFRRALESLSLRIQTLGFAGFFGLTASHHRFASDVAEHRLPVLLNPGLTSWSGSAADAASDQSARYKARASRAWGRFKLAAVSSFAFVEASGPLYIAKLVRDALGLVRNGAPNDPEPRLDPALDLSSRVQMATTILRAMSLTRDFAPLVLLAGHGASVVNNPHAAALHCGACGGYSGEVNARLLAALLNDNDVRQGLQENGISIPTDTLFVGALHDTTTDDVTLYVNEAGAAHDRDDLAQARQWLATAGTLTRAERALRLPRATGESSIAARSRSWAETRPEWGLAGCKAFIAAPRGRTSGKNLGGRAFLHDYNWHHDDGFGVLELIITAPVVVASWISLQYYGSTVAPDVFGGGNKLLHNVIGGIGVVEGNGGVLRAGLPWQSIHDGVELAHEPLRLTVCIEAPREAITAVLEKHPDVRALFDNHWLHLFALDESGAMAWRYSGNLKWKATAEVTAPEPEPELVS
jgi:uncharacterized protein